MRRAKWILKGAILKVIADKKKLKLKHGLPTTEEVREKEIMDLALRDDIDTEAIDAMMKCARTEFDDSPLINILSFLVTQLLRFYIPYETFFKQLDRYLHLPAGEHILPYSLETVSNQVHFLYHSLAALLAFKDKMMTEEQIAGLERLDREDLQGIRMLYEQYLALAEES